MSLPGEETAAGSRGWRQGRRPRQAGPGASAGLAQQALDVLLHRAWRQIQPCCDLLVGQPAGDKAQHVRLSGGDSRCHPGIGLRLLEQLAAALGQAGQVPAIKSGLGLGQPAKRVAPSVGERSGGGAEPRPGRPSPRSS